MFTGIVETMGEVVERTPSPAGARLVVGHDLDGDLAVGDSVSVNGCCVTATDLGGGRFAVDLMGETLRRTGLGTLDVGTVVNLERAVGVNGRFDGHLVQGHVDGVGTVTAWTPHDAWTVMAVTAPATLAPYLVEKGSVAVDGVSLTIMGVAEAPPDAAEGDGVVFEIGLIPHTMAVTTLGRRRPGDIVNLEVDVIAKYVQRLLSAGVSTPYQP